MSRKFAEISPEKTSKNSLSGLIDSKPKTIFISLLGGSIAVAAYILVRKVLDTRPPKQLVKIICNPKQNFHSNSYFRWRKVGEISDLLCFPIKSCGAVRAHSFDCSPIGLQLGYLRDRTFMVVDLNGEFVSGRSHPQLVLVKPTIDGDTLHLSAPGMINLLVDITQVQLTEPFRAIVWGQLVEAVDVGEEAARWFSRYLLQDDFGLRFLYYPSPTPSRKLKKKTFFGIDLSPDTGAFHDTISFLMINEGSIAELNSRVKVPTSALQFRPNFVVKGPAAFEEDNWKWVKIGDETIFRNVKPCKR